MIAKHNPYLANLVLFGRVLVNGMTLRTLPRLWAECMSHAMPRAESQLPIRLVRDDRPCRANNVILPSGIGPRTAVVGSCHEQ